MSAMVMSDIKKMHNYIGERLTAVSAAYAVYRTKNIELLSKKISKRSMGTPTETVPLLLQR